MDYLLTGGQAVILYGVQRQSIDFDIIVPYWEIENVIDIVYDLGYREAKVLGGIVKLDSLTPENIRKVKLFRFIGKYHVDVFVFHEDKEEFWNRLWSHRVEVWDEDVPIQILHIKDIIGLKSQSKRRKDIDDVKELQKIMEDTKYGKT